MDIVERLRDRLTFKAAYQATHLHSPDWNKGDLWLNEAADEIERLQRVIAWANNSLFGSHGFFLSMNGGEPDEHHLDRAIEDLKERNRKLYAELSTARRTALQEAADIVEALEDKIDGLSADLDNAVEVAYRRGATEWTRLNYPDHFARLSASPSPAGESRDAVEASGDWLTDREREW